MKTLLTISMLLLLSYSSIGQESDHIDNVWMINAIVSWIAGVLCCFFLLRFLYAFIMGYLKTHVEKKVLDDQGNHKKFDDGKPMYDKPDKSWGTWTGIIIDNGLGFLFMLIISLVMHMISIQTPEIGQ